MAAPPPAPTRYIVYADESGDHGLANISLEYPVFVLVFCVFRQADYMAQASPALQGLKFKYFGHDIVVFHEKEIRKAEGLFGFLTNQSLRNAFLTDVNAFVSSLPVTVIASAIDKVKHKAQYGPSANNPYDLSLAFCLERLHWHLSENGASQEPTRIVFERRGKVEDAALELEFRRVCAGLNALEHGRGKALPFEIVFADKRVNSAGLQIADLMGRPIGRHVIAPGSPNPPFGIIQPKIRSRGGSVYGAGLKVFPP